MSENVNDNNRCVFSESPRRYSYREWGQVFYDIQTYSAGEYYLPSLAVGRVIKIFGTDWIVTKLTDTHITVQCDHSAGYCPSLMSRDMEGE